MHRNGKNQMTCESDLQPKSKLNFNNLWFLKVIAIEVKTFRRLSKYFFGKNACIKFGIRELSPVQSSVLIYCISYTILVPINAYR